MANRGANLFSRWTWLAAFVVAAVTSDWTLAQAQESQKKPAKQKAKSPAPPTTSVPGAGTKVDAARLTKIIDQEINRKLAEEKIPASARSDDAEFYRRVHLDLVGVIPSGEKVAAFLSNTDPARRSKVIDELLADPRFGKSLAENWSGLMVPRESNNRRLDNTPLQTWLGEKFNSTEPLNKIVYQLLTAIGEQDKNGAVTYFIGNPTVDKITDNVSRMFLGVQLQCAQCHNHPFTDYKQNEYWGMAQFFMKVRLTQAVNKAAKAGTQVGIFEVTGNAAGKGKKNMLPESAKMVPAKFLQGDEPKIKTDDPARPVVADWITNGKNPFFAKAMVNRFWYQMFGRGLVNPVDDMHDENPASHPELLAALTEQFTRNEFDIRYLLRAICNSEAYQRTSKPVEGNADDLTYFSHRRVRVLSPEQLFDSLSSVVSRADRDRGGNATGKKGPAQGSRDAFTNFFRIDEGADPLDYQMGIPQALRLMNSPQFNNNNPTVAQAMQGARSTAEVVEKLFLRTLSRRPTAQELDRFSAHVSKAADARTGYGDILWALINSSEFTLNP